MKRILAIAFVLQILISSACLAFEPPMEERWEFLGKNDKFEMWFDSDRIVYKNQDDIFQRGHDGHKVVEIWVMIHDFDKSGFFIAQFINDISCDSVAIKTTVKYNDNKDVEFSNTNKYLDFEPTVPNSIGEDLNILSKHLWEKNNK